MFQDSGRPDVFLLLAKHILQPGEDHDHTVVAVVQRFLHRHRVSDAAIVIRYAVDHIRFAGDRHGGRGLHDVEIVVADIRLVEIFGRTVFRIAGDDGETGRIRLEGFIVDRIFAVMIAQRAVHIVQVGEIVISDVTVEAGIFLTERILRVKLMVASMLPGDEGDHVRATCGDAIAVVDADAVLHHAIHHARSEDRPEATANIDHRRLVRHGCRPFVRSHDFTRVLGTFAFSDEEEPRLIRQFVRKCRNWRVRFRRRLGPERVCPMIRE